MTAIKPYWMKCYRMIGDGVQAPGAIVLRAISNQHHPFVVHFWNEQDNGYHDGDYCKTLGEAVEAYDKRCKRYDPTKELHIGWLTKQLEMRCNLRKVQPKDDILDSVDPSWADD